MYVVLILISIPILFVSGIDVATPIQTILDLVGAMTSGAILVFLFFSLLKDKF